MTTLNLERKAYLEMAHDGNPYLSSQHLVIIVVNESAKADSDIDKNPSPPSITQSVNAVTDAQLHLYNNETIDLARSLLVEWETEMTIDTRLTQSHFIIVDLKSITQESLSKGINRIPTTLGLPGKDVDLLIETGRTLLRNNENFIRCINALSAE